MYCDFVHNKLYWSQAENNLSVTSPMLWPLPQLTVATEGCKIGNYRSLWLKAAFERSHRDLDSSFIVVVLYKWKIPMFKISYPL